MLLSLNVKNYALISDVDMHFDKGMNIITGETGAGKSILIGALGLALGKRADTSSLRNKETKCVIEATFDVSGYDLHNVYDHHDLDYEEQTILRREIASSGKSRSFINDTPVNLSTLNDLGSRLIEIHSQHDNLQLFKQDFQYYSLDALSGSLDLQREYAAALRVLKKEKTELDKLQNQEAEWSKEADFNQFLLDELAAAQLEEVAEDELTAEQELLENAEELIHTFNEADQLLGGTEYAIVAQLQELRNTLRSQKTAMTENLSERIDSVLIEVQDIAGEIDKSVQGIEVNPQRLAEVNDKMGQLFNLKSKHRVTTVAELITLRHELEDKMGVTQNLSGDIAILEQSIAKKEKDLFALAQKLSKKRMTQSVTIAERIDALLAQLGMQHSHIQYALSETKELNAFGCNELSLQLSSDKGNTFAELKKAASGGELARINLSLKSVLADFVKMPSSIYDEIDTGVSGEIARKVGGMMGEMSATQQVIVITHLPQIASLGDNHLFVYKQENAVTIETKVKTLTGDERVNEIAKMISGDTLTAHAVEQSKELLKG
ncbi:MAG: DNA repair protein RecN [Bacteroidetes bacterium]|mgnify:FL=1|jgi:DNA repair protein RecN (Recombination protein N)|nr:DNA repair protein RecN [Bacteroidota bacterium]